MKQCWRRYLKIKIKPPLKNYALEAGCIRVLNVELWGCRLRWAGFMRVLDTWGGLVLAMATWGCWLWYWILEDCSFCDWQHEVAGCGTGYWRGARFGNDNMWLLAVGLDAGRGARFVTGNMRLLAVGLGYWRGACFVTGNMRLLAVVLDTGGVLVLWLATWGCWLWDWILEGARFVTGNMRLLAVGLDTEWVLVLWLATWGCWLWDWTLNGCSIHFVTNKMWLQAVDIRDVSGDTRLLSDRGIHKRAGSGTYVRLPIVRFDTWGRWLRWYWLRGWITERLAVGGGSRHDTFYICVLAVGLALPSSSLLEERRGLSSASPKCFTILRLHSGHFRLASSQESMQARWKLWAQGRRRACWPPSSGSRQTVHSPSPPSSSSATTTRDTHLSASFACRPSRRSSSSCTCKWTSSRH